MARKRTPLKKVQLQSSTVTDKSQNLYQINNQKLRFIPTIFVVSIGLIIAGGVAWYLNKPQPTQTPTEIAGVRQIVMRETPNSSQTPTTTQPQETQTTNSTSLQITNTENNTCDLIFSQTPPKLQPIINKSTQGWWVPQNCFDSNLLAIQILRLNDQEIQNLPPNPTHSLLKIDDIDTYAISYYQQIPQESSTYNLASYIQPLTQPIFSDRVYFNSANAFDTKKIQDHIYYLDGDCQNNQQTPCKLWMLDTFSGQLKLLQNQIIPSKADYNIQPGYYLRFAKIQDYEQGINLILVNSNNLSYKLLRLNLQNLNINASTEITNSDPNHRVYFR